MWECTWYIRTIHGKDLLNYKSLECYQRMLNGKGTSMASAEAGDQRIFNAEVSMVMQLSSLHSCEGNSASHFRSTVLKG